MSNKYYTYERIVKQAKTVKNSVEKEQKISGTRKWSYYFAMAILNPKKNITRIDFDLPRAVEGDYISRDIYYSSYKDMAERVTKFTRANNKLPVTVKHTVKSGKSYLIRCDLYVYLFAKILVYYDKHGEFPQPVNLSSKVFVKPSETGNIVFDYFVRKAGFRPTCIDDVCDWVKNKVDYEFYFDDQKSNKQVIDSKAGNCTDLLQFLVNMADAMGYKWEVIHTKCKQSGTGHVYGKFYKQSTGWFIRDIACIADESRYCVWCNVDDGAGYLLARNPSWFLQNLNK